MHYCRKWKCIDHRDTISPFEEAPFINFETSLSLKPVTMGNKTFVEWQGTYSQEDSASTFGPLYSYVIVHKLHLPFTSMLKLKFNNCKVDHIVHMVPRAAVKTGWQCNLSLLDHSRIKVQVNNGDSGGMRCLTVLLRIVLYRAPICCLNARNPGRLV